MGLPPPATYNPAQLTVPLSQQYGYGEGGSSTEEDEGDVRDNRSDDEDDKGPKDVRGEWLWRVVVGWVR
jgi:hypothetical protein